MCVLDFLRGGYRRILSDASEGAAIAAAVTLNFQTVDHKKMARDQFTCPDVKSHRLGAHVDGWLLRAARLCAHGPHRARARVAACSRARFLLLAGFALVPIQIIANVNAQMSRGPTKVLRIPFNIKLELRPLAMAPRTASASTSRVVRFP